MKVWIVWEDSYSDSYPASIHSTAAGAEVEAARLATEDWSRDKARHDAAEQRRIETDGTWMFTGPFGNGITFHYDGSGTATIDDGRVIQGVFQPTTPRPEPTPFEGKPSDYERRVDEYEVAGADLEGGA